MAGLARIVLEVRADNAGARAFYQRLGYRTLERVPGYYGGREAAVHGARAVIDPAVPVHRPAATEDCFAEGGHPPTEWWNAPADAVVPWPAPAVEPGVTSADIAGRTRPSGL